MLTTTLLKKVLYSKIYTNNQKLKVMLKNGLFPTDYLYFIDEDFGHCVRVIFRVPKREVKK